MDFNINDLAPYAEGAFLTAGLQDWQQTRQIQDHLGYKEANPMLGSKPSAKRINTYMPLAGLTQLGGYAMLPDNYKLPYALASALYEGNIVRGNKKLGLGLNAPALGLGALATLALQNEWSKKHKASVGVNKIDNTYVPTLNMQF